MTHMVLEAKGVGFPSPVSNHSHMGSYSKSVCNIAEAAKDAEAIAWSLPMASEHSSPSETASNNSAQPENSERSLDCPSRSSRAVCMMPAALR